ncbi:MAG: transcription elongation factor GreA [bacterium]|nr:transcription elongation factor GreA [bacterium]
MLERSPITADGHRQLQAEVKRLTTIERPKAAQAIATARAHGDLSENAEYDAAKEAQGLLEARIRMLESRLSTALVVDIEKLSGTKVVFGATVTIVDGDSGEERTLTIVGEDESDVEKGLISFQSPIARGLIGKSIDDVVEIRLPSGLREYEITDVQFVVPEVRIGGAR